MKIKSSGIEITDICEQVPNILVNSSGMARIAVRTPAGGLATSNEMTHTDLAALREAIDAAMENMRPHAVQDKMGDVWTWLDSHRGYVINTEDHKNCYQNGCEGRSLDYVETNWGPVALLP